MKIEVTEEREIRFTLTKREGADLNEHMMGATHVPGSLADQFHRKLVDALFQAMREHDAVGPV